MKTVYLVRHTTAMDKSESVPDFERSLVEGGVKQATEVAERFKQKGAACDRLVSSHAYRAVETAHVFADTLKYPRREIQLSETLYDSDNHEEFLPIIQRQPNELSSVMLVGHDPTFSDLARWLAEEHQEKMSKGTVLGIKFDVDSWSEIKPGQGQVVYRDTPAKD